MIAAFGIPDEPEPGVIVLPDSKIKGVHLTRLAADGSDRDRGEKAKIMIGFSKGQPIVLSPPTDGLALIVSEGIESGLSGFEATGLAPGRRQRVATARTGGCRAGLGWERNNTGGQRY